MKARTRRAILAVAQVSHTWGTSRTRAKQGDISCRLKL